MSTFERFISVQDLAANLGVSPNWVYERAAKGELPSYVLGGKRRFRLSEVEDWLQTQKTTPPTPLRQVRASG